MISRAMIHGRMMARVVLLVGTALACTGYTSCSFNSGPGELPDPHDDQDSFATTLTLRNVSGEETASFVFGEPIRLDLEIVNLTNREIRVPFPDTQDHDFLVANSAATQVRWRWSQNMAFSPVTGELSFPPNASKTFTLYWPGTLADGTQLPAGSYTARGAVVFDGFRTNPLAADEKASDFEPFTVR